MAAQWRRRLAAWQQPTWRTVRPASVCGKHVNIQVIVVWSEVSGLNSDTAPPGFLNLITTPLLLHPFKDLKPSYCKIACLS